MELAQQEEDCSTDAVFPRAFGYPDGATAADSDPSITNYEIESMVYSSNLEALIAVGSQKYSKQS